MGWVEEAARWFSYSRIDSFSARDTFRGKEGGSKEDGERRMREKWIRNRVELPYLDLPHESAVSSLCTAILVDYQSHGGRERVAAGHHHLHHPLQ